MTRAGFDEPVAKPRNTEEMDGEVQLRKVASIVASAAVSVAFVMSAPAHAVAILAVPGSFTAGYATPQAAATTNQAVTFYNADSATHNVVSKVFGPDTNPWCHTYGYTLHHCPLFRSDDVALGGTTVVAGVDKLAAGDYAFFCSYHATSMKGSLKLVAGA